MNEFIKLERVTVQYDDNVVLDDFDIAFEEGKFYTLLGPSGCGKTTILNLIAGFVRQDLGKVYIDGQIVDDIDPAKRNVNTIFQDYALFPHLNVYDNIAFGLKLKKNKKSEIFEKVRSSLELVGLTGYEKREISELSGGQKQRVAIARAIVNEPKVLLLDEPLSALDLKLRRDMQYMLKEIQERLSITFIFVTHDQEEALTLSDYIYVLEDGKIRQEGIPTDIYDEPENEFVADFIGDSNIVSGVMIKDYEVTFANEVFECVDKGFDRDQHVKIVIRPEDFTIKEAQAGKFDVEIVSKVFKGIHYEFLCEDLANNTWKVHTIKNFEVGSKVSLDFEPFDIHVMEANEE